MESKPKRIQRRRVKGWKLPPNTVYVGRPTKWGNPYKVGLGCTQWQAMQRYIDKLDSNVWTPPTMREIREELRGKDLACWCPLVDKNGNAVPCHADVLLEIANG